MKKCFYLLALLAVFAACQKQPSATETDGEYLVYTEYDNEFNFNEPKTFYVPDSLLVMGSGDKAFYSKTPSTDQLRNAYIEEMEEKGYTLVEEKENADLGIQLSYISTTHHFVDYNQPYWWNYYPGYWSPFYWGDWGYWGYGYPVHYTYTTNALMAEMLDLNAEEGSGKSLPVVWSNCITGDYSSVQQINQIRFMNGIRQAFVQSAYIGTK